MATSQLDALWPALAGTLYARWQSAVQYQLINLASDPAACRWISLDLLEMLAFDQCLVFGAACPQATDSLDRLAQRDAVVRRTRNTLWAVYGWVTKRMPPERRLRLLHEVAQAVECGTGSAASLLPFVECDPDASIKAAASQRANALRQAVAHEATSD